MQWDASRMTTIATQPPHVLGMVSLDVDESGTRVLYNSIEGITSLWDTSVGHKAVKHESFVRTGAQSTEPGLLLLVSHPPYHRVTVLAADPHFAHSDHVSQPGLWPSTPKPPSMLQQAAPATLHCTPQNVIHLARFSAHSAPVAPNSACSPHLCALLLYRPS